MPSFTQAAIKQSFLKLLEQYPLSKITVKMIVLDCGINRNTFYYHFEDIPMLLEKVIEDEINAIADQLPENFSLIEGAQTLLSYLVKNKKKVGHIWNSSTREFYEMHLMKICDYISRRFIKRLGEETAKGETEALYADLLKYELFGLIIDWINHDMSFDIVERANQMGALLNDKFEFEIK